MNKGNIDDEDPDEVYDIISDKFYKGDAFFESLDLERDGIGEFEKLEYTWGSVVETFIQSLWYAVLVPTVLVLVSVLMIFPDYRLLPLSDDDIKHVSFFELASDKIFIILNLVCFDALRWLIDGEGLIVNDLGWDLFWLL
eukprot:UN27361